MNRRDSNRDTASTFKLFSGLSDCVVCINALNSSDLRHPPYVYHRITIIIIARSHLYIYINIYIVYAHARPQQNSQPFGLENRNRKLETTMFIVHDTRVHGNDEVPLWREWEVYRRLIVSAYKTSESTQRIYIYANVSACANTTWVTSNHRGSPPHGGGATFCQWCVALLRHMNSSLFVIRTRLEVWNSASNPELLRINSRTIRPATGNGM